jgi:hypothetical protein
MKTLSKGLLSVCFALSACMGSAQRISKLTLAPSSVMGGGVVTATVEITPKAGKAPVVVTLASSNKISTVPAKAEIPVGAATTTFQVNTTAVEADTSSVITATVGKASATANLTILIPKVTKLTLAPASVMGGTESTATIELNAKVGATPVTVALKCSNKSLIEQ